MMTGRIPPQSVSAGERAGIRPHPDSVRQVAEMLGVATADDYVIDFERGFQLSDDVQDMTSPLLLPQAPAARLADVLFVGPSPYVRQMRQLHRFEHSIDDER